MSRTPTPPLTEEPPLPPRERGTGRAILLALVMHALLALLLYHGVQWPNSTPAGAEAELWTAPEVVTPPPVVAPAPAPVVAPPPPPVPDEQAEIALQQKKQREAQARQAALDAERQARLDAQRKADERRAAALAAAAAAAEAAHLADQKAAAKAAERQKLQAQEQLKQLQARQKQQELQQQLEQQKQLQQQKLAEQKATQDAARKAAAAEKAAAAKAAAAKAAKARAAEAAAQNQLNSERASRLAQLQGMASGEGLSNAGSGNGSGGNAASPGYPDKVRRQVKPNITYGGATDGLTTIVMVHCAPSGTVLSVSVTKRSGNPTWDNAVVDAVRASSPLPPDIDGKTPPNIRIVFHASEGG